jgi:hypothetical protein
MTVAILIETNKKKTLQILVVCILDIKIPHTTHRICHVLHS